MDNIEEFTPDPIVKLTERIKLNADKNPYGIAVIKPVSKDKSGRTTFSHLTFKRLDEETDHLAKELEYAGMRKGLRTLVMMEPGPDYISIVYALFKIGAVPVIMSPGITQKEFLSCVKDASIEAFIGSARGHLIRILNASCFKSVTTVFTCGQKFFWGGHFISTNTTEASSEFKTDALKENDTALIFYTPGVTGRSKGVIHTLSSLDATISNLVKLFDVRKDDVNLSLHPYFLLLFPAMGMTSVIPDIDLNFPLEADMSRITDLVTQIGITHIMASPSIFSMIGDCMTEGEIVLPSIRKIIVFGTQIIPEFMTDFMTGINEAVNIVLSYGSTEVFPVSTLDCKEMLTETKHLSEKGFGTCIGKPVSGLNIELITASDDSITHLRNEVMVSDGNVGEIVINGTPVSPSYYEYAKADAYSKITDSDKSVWHRSGDLAWRDKKGRLWLCGRKSQAVKTTQGPLFTISCETIFNMHPDVHRSALVGVGDTSNQTPVMLVELEKKCGKRRKTEIVEELLELARSNEATHMIETILIHEGFPVDGYHLSKIIREELRIFAEKIMLG
ncbi:MAG: AMP-binding protein [Proteobacteria bacterium]|nr:AMP-binding protein [Pseudomonadota bacterium]